MAAPEVHDGGAAAAAAAAYSSDDDDDDDEETIACPATDEELRKTINYLTSELDMDKTNMKGFLVLLANRLSGSEAGSDDLYKSHIEDLTKRRKKFVKRAVTEAISKKSAAAAPAVQKQAAAGGAGKQAEKNEEETRDEEESEEEEKEESEESEGDDDSDSDDDTPPVKKKKRKGGGGGGLAEKKQISEALASFVGRGETEMSRTEIVKFLWQYIREHDLQNPKDRREILLDERMRDVFGCNTFTMFSMNKYIGAHIHPFKPVDLSTSSTKRRTSRSSTAAASGGKRTRGSKSKSDRPIKKRKSGSQPPFLLSEEMQDVVGESVLPRPQVVSAIWVYIKKHNLQNPNDKREILCDAKLKRVMKKAKVTMFSMNQCISQHLIEKVERPVVSTEYDNDDDDE